MCGDTLINLKTGNDFKRHKNKRPYKSVDNTRHTTEIEEPDIQSTTGTSKTSKKLYVPVVKQ
jgi:hypothetical protein